ncbi:hypothetical protein C0Q70_09994 [Pomacea canaliculata]|uniref:Neurotransmitter-gated ion-channel ligand-binding domain-containing protein n=1 Tax=Pomacea canaliculata TaxID=400727 RepID=A0A2T7PBC9_POMCA|nr:hypothetical protein C0Q70_09994 [Pomacea canaliculata]
MEEVQEPKDFRGEGERRRSSLARSFQFTKDDLRLMEEAVSHWQADHRHSYDNLFQEGNYREYDHQVKVEMKATFMKVMDIDTLSQQFEAEAFIQAKWEEPIFSGMSQQELNQLLPTDFWNPQLKVMNLAGDYDQERRSYLVRYEVGCTSPVVLHRWRFKGVFRESLELKHFPFDVQDLSLQISSERSVDEIKMVHDPWHLSSVNTKAFQDSQEWHVECIFKRTSMEYASSAIHPILYFTVRVKRNVGYFLWNVVFIVFLILLLTFTTASIDPTSSDRLVSTITLFLTLVAFKMVVKQSLPTISYLTYLDMYILASLLFLAVYSIENAFIAGHKTTVNNDLLKQYDELAILGLGILLIIYHLLFIIHIQVTALKRRRQMADLDKKYAIQAQELYAKRREFLSSAKPSPQPEKLIKPRSIS